MKGPKNRLAMVAANQIKAYWELRKACEEVAADQSSIELLPDARDNLLFKVVASEVASPGVRIDHPVPWQLSYRAMLAEMQSLTKAIGVESSIHAANKLAKKRPKL